MAEGERTLFTIAHSTHELAEFLQLLRGQGAVFEHGRTSYSLPFTDPLCAAKLDARVPVGPD